MMKKICACALSIFMMIGLIAPAGVAAKGNDLVVNDCDETVSENVVQATALGHAIVQDARSFIGKLPWINGGTSLTSGSDCSYFVQQMFLRNGVNIGRFGMYERRYEIGTVLSEGNKLVGGLEDGDVIVYVGHVAICTSNGTIVECVGGDVDNVREININKANPGTAVRCIIRPYALQGESIPVTDNISFSGDVCTPDYTDAYVFVTANASRYGRFTSSGIRVWDASNKLVAQKDEGSSYSRNSLDIWYNITAETGAVLSRGATYHYQIYTVFEGKTYWTDTKYFTTKSDYAIQSYKSRVFIPAYTEAPLYSSYDGTTPVATTTSTTDSTYCESDGYIDFSDGRRRYRVSISGTTYWVDSANTSSVMFYVSSLKVKVPENWILNTESEPFFVEVSVEPSFATELVDIETSGDGYLHCQMNENYSNKWFHAEDHRFYVDPGRNGQCRITLRGQCSNVSTSFDVDIVDDSAPIISDYEITEQNDEGFSVKAYVTSKNKSGEAVQSTESIGFQVWVDGESLSDGQFDWMDGEINWSQKAEYTVKYVDGLYGEYQIGLMAMDAYGNMAMEMLSVDRVDPNPPKSSSSSSSSKKSSSSSKKSSSSSKKSSSSGKSSSSSSSGSISDLGNIRYIVDDDTQLESVVNKYIYGMRMKITTVASKPGYKFAGWYLDSTCRIKAKITGKTRGELVLYPKWKPCGYTIEYMSDAKNGVLVSKQKLTLDKQKQIKLPSERKLLAKNIDFSKIKGWSVLVTTSFDGTQIPEVDGRVIEADIVNHTVSYISNEIIITNGMPQAMAEEKYRSYINFTRKGKGYTGVVRLYPVY